ncbi:ERF family protein [Leptospira noguchii]|uniref:Erf family protein n=1 Tax=Leptospira noguchii TaxID=28182 RepID=M6VAK4_9LEPT|nr:ERF family protein [Leptospira noguchii]EMO53915.1 Erf family protein [Leptospira noguchii]
MTTAIHSEQINEIAKALSNAQGEFPDIPKSKTVMVNSREGKPSYSYKYADLADIITAVRSVLQKSGLAVSQVVTGGHTGNLVTTILMHESGQFLRSEIAIDKYSNMQQLGSALTYIRRYAYCGILGIQADEDDDAQNLNGSKSNKQQNQKTPPSSGKEAPPANQAQQENPTPKKENKSLEDKLADTKAWIEGVLEDENINQKDAIKKLTNCRNLWKGLYQEFSKANKVALYQDGLTQFDRALGALGHTEETDEEDAF